MHVWFIADITKRYQKSLISELTYCKTYIESGIDILVHIEGGTDNGTYRGVNSRTDGQLVEQTKRQLAGRTDEQTDRQTEDNIV